MRLQRLKDYIINTDFCPKCSNSDIHKSAYKKKISPLFEALYKLTNQSGESFSRTREKIIKRVETFNLCNACSVNLAESINKYLDEFLTFDFENISFKSKQHEEQKELKECPFCSELIDKNLDECPFCAEKLE
jgi:predicted ribosome quality control (RQC) complex YloA/Tae2 family protein